MRAKCGPFAPSPYAALPLQSSPPRSSTRKHARARSVRTRAGSSPFPPAPSGWGRPAGPPSSPVRCSEPATANPPVGACLAFSFDTCVERLPKCRGGGRLLHERGKRNPTACQLTTTATHGWEEAQELQVFFGRSRCRRWSNLKDDAPALRGIAPAARRQELAVAAGHVGAAEAVRAAAGRPARPISPAYPRSGQCAGPGPGLTRSGLRCGLGSTCLCAMAARGFALPRPGPARAFEVQ